MSWLDLQDVVGGDFAETLPLDVINVPEVTITNRRRHTKPSGDIAIPDVIGSSWPVSGEDVSQLTQGKYKVGGRLIFTVGDPLRVADERKGGKGTNGSILTVGSDEFEIVHRENWDRGGFAKYVGVIIKRRKLP